MEKSLAVGIPAAVSQLSGAGSDDCGYSNWRSIEAWLAMLGWECRQTLRSALARQELV